MKKNTKGFTLIELLAVIVILALIALIATPIVLGLIKKARIGATQDSAYGLRKVAQLYYSTSIITNPDFFDTAFVCKKVGDTNGCWKAADYADPKAPASVDDDTERLEIDGTVPSSGTITISTHGKITYTDIKYNDNHFECTVPETGTITCTAKD